MSPLALGGRRAATIRWMSAWHGMRPLDVSETWEEAAWLRT